MTLFVDLSQKPQVHHLLKKQVARVNTILPPGAQVTRFVSLHKEFDADEGEMTRTRKLRRRHLQERYGEIIAALCNGADSIKVSASVKYRDAREGTVETDLQIISMDPEEASS